MEIYSVPTGQQQAIQSTLKERNDLEGEIARLSNALQQTVAKKQMVEGKLNGLLQGMAISAGFDLQTEVILSDDLQTLSGTKMVEDQEEKTAQES